MCRSGCPTGAGNTTYVIALGHTQPDMGGSGAGGMSLEWMTNSRTWHPHLLPVSFEAEVPSDGAARDECKGVFTGSGIDLPGL